MGLLRGEALKEGHLLKDAVEARLLWILTLKVRAAVFSFSGNK